MRKVRLSDLFFKHFARFTEDEQRIIFGKIAMLQEGSERKSLRVKKLHGTYKTWFESSVSMGIRIFWRYNRDKTVIIVEDVGRHDMLRKYG